MRRVLPSPGRFLASLTAALAGLAAQGHPAPPRPVPGLVAPRLLPDLLPPPRSQDTGLGFTMLAGPRGPRVAWFDTELHDAAMAGCVARGEPVAARTTSVWSLVAGDFDGDGTDDFVARRGNDPVLLRPEREPQPLPAAATPAARDATWCTGRAADWDGDGRADLACCHDGIVLLQHDVLGAGLVSELADLRPTLGSDTVPVATVGDYDLDGLPDLVLALPQRGLVWCRNEGTRRAPRLSAPIPLWPEPPGTVVLAILLVPVDDDPWPDVVLATAAPATAAEPGIRVRLPRWRTAAEEAALATARAEQTAFEQSAARQRAGIAGLGPAPSDPFAMLLDRRNHQTRVDALRWQVQYMVPQPLCVQLREPGR